MCVDFCFLPMLGVPFDMITTSEDNAATDERVMSITQRIATTLQTKKVGDRVESIFQHLDKWVFCWAFLRHN